MEKKISFGFNKVSKKINLLTNKLVPKDEKVKVELITSIEEQSIQLVEKLVEESPLIIPLKDGQKTSAALLSLRTRQAVLNGEDIPLEEEKQKIKDDDIQTNGNNEDIEKRAARELLAEVSKNISEEDTSNNLVLPVKTEDLPLDGAKESTIDDYESIPITQFGLAMLRGMGWKDQSKKKGTPIEEVPIMRPKGMGLGADKALKPKVLLVPPEANETLEIKKSAFVLVLAGKHKDLYGQIEGLDDHAGRVIVKMALGGIKETFNEFMVQPVSKKEYAQFSKCINSKKYDEYKKMENKHGQILIKTEQIKKESIEKHERDSTYDTTCKYNDDGRKYEKSNLSSRRYSGETKDLLLKTERRSRSLDRKNIDYQRGSTSTSHKKYSTRHRSQSDVSRSSSNSTYHSKHKKKSKSKKSKKNKDRSRERKRESSEDERKHKKKTKKSKRERSRSRSKGRR